MGLVTCSKCNKTYDYNKYNGICPKCARYNKETTSAQDHQEHHNKYDSGYSHTAQDNHHSYHQRYDSDTNPHEKKKTMDKKTKIVIGFFIAIFVINLLPFVGFLVIPILIGVLMYVVNKTNKKKK